MLALPLIAPPDDQSTWSRNIRRAESPPPSQQTATLTAVAGATAGTLAQQTHQQRQQRQQRDEEKRLQQARSPLALLAAEEAAIAQHKASIRNFGSYWIRPPGISKTLQAMIEEDIERREQEEMERQEQNMMDMQAQQQLQEQQQRAEAEGAQEEEDAGGERNLDDEVPEAEEEEEATFNEESLEEGSALEQGQEVYEELEEAEMTGIARDEEELGIEHERNLDDSVPEAVSFQHTDSEIEHSTDESELEDSMLGQAHRQQAARRQNAAVAPPFGRSRQLRQALAGSGLPRSPGSMTLSSPQIESSFANSSPVLARGSRQARSDGRRGNGQ